LSLIEAETSKGATKEIEIKILANEVHSQVALHQQYGGVLPNLAKREHGRNLIPLFKKILAESGFWELGIRNYELGIDTREKIEKILNRETELLAQFLEFIPTIEKPKTRPVRSREGSQRDSASNGIDLIAVTAGPGLEPALWVGINFAKALSVVWNIPVVATNHMEGHVLISLLKGNEEFSIINFQLSKLKRNEEFSDATRFTLHAPAFPAIALLVSGGHTELVLMKNWLQYEIVGKTRDDALGEAFDKVARILGLPYPGGPQISSIAEKARKSRIQDCRFPIQELRLPRPMIKSDDLDFSFSGLKTAVLYLVKKLPTPISGETKAEIACEFEDSATEVVVEKVKKAVSIYGAKSLILGGGVVANKNIRKAFEKLAGENPPLTLHIPEINHATDNALMIAIAGFFNRNKAVSETTGLLEIKADGNLHF